MKAHKLFLNVLLLILGSQSYKVTVLLRVQFFREAQVQPLSFQVTWMVIPITKRYKHIRIILPAATNGASARVPRLSEGSNIFDANISRFSKLSTHPSLGKGQ